MEASTQPTPDRPPTAIDTGAQQVAAVYAKAFVGAAATAGQAEAAIAELESFVHDVLDRFPRLQAVLESNFIKPDEKVAILQRTLSGRASPTVLVFLKVLAAHERLNCLRAVCQAARALHDQMLGRVRVDVATAAPLTDALGARLAAQLREMLGGEPILVPRTDPELIGGIVLRVGDAVYDGSVATQLAAIRGRMINRSVHEIQSRRDRFSNPSGN
jgi:F-type H+-transporting ATPase subunit delta